MLSTDFFTRVRKSELGLVRSLGVHVLSPRPVVGPLLLPFRVGEPTLVRLATTSFRSPGVREIFGYYFKFLVTPSTAVRLLPRSPVLTTQRFTPRPSVGSAVPKVGLGVWVSGLVGPRLRTLNRL